MANKGTKHDPLEAAKVTAGRMAEDDASIARTDWRGSAADGDEKPSEPPTAPSSPPPTAPRPRVRKTLYEVMVTKAANVGRGQVHTFKAGTRLDPTTYDGGITKLKKFGLELKPVEVEVEG